MKIVGLYNAPAMVTQTGLLCSLAAIFLAFNQFKEFAVVALIWAGVFDLFDGLVARSKMRTPREREFGMQIDSLVDLVSFGVAPVVVALSFGAGGAWFYLFASLYVCASSQRIAYFNLTYSRSVTESNARITHYSGLPVTFAALIFGVGFCAESILNPELFSVYINTLFFLTTCLYLLPTRIPKPRGAVYIIMPTLAIAFSSYWGLLGWRGL